MPLLVVGRTVKERCLLEACEGRERVKQTNDTKALSRPGSEAIQESVLAGSGDPGDPVAAAVAATVASVGLLARLDVFDLTSPPGRGTAPAVLWLFAVGWSAALAHQAWQRLLLVAIVAVGLPGFMGNSVREWTIAAGILVLIWLPNLPVPRVVVPALGVAVTFVLSALAGLVAFVVLLVVVAWSACKQQVQ